MSYKLMSVTNRFVSDSGCVGRVFSNHHTVSQFAILFPDSCLDIQKGGSTSGHYSIFTSSGSTLDVWCDMDSGGGGWLVPESLSLSVDLSAYLYSLQKSLGRTFTNRLINKLLLI